jgi:hypothetical protein
MEGATGKTEALAKGMKGEVPLKVWKWYRAKSEPAEARPDYEPLWRIKWARPHSDIENNLHT